jgi:serine/threonine protein kinase
MAFQPKPGSKVGRYTLTKHLGSGASGEVWTASDGTKPVAIKFLREQLIESDASERHLQRLENEINALSRLHFFHIPTLYDYDLQFERPYLVMQYISGKSYEDLIATGDMLNIRLDKRLAALKTMAETISAVHEMGIIHRDIKPASINGIENPYLLDFSIAIDVANATDAHPDVGTGIYMPPPEEPPGKCADNYAFAVVAYEVLFGCHPIFTAENIADTIQGNRQLTKVRLQRREWRLPSRIAPEELPGDMRGVDLDRLDKIFERALRTRYSYLPDFVADLAGTILVPENRPYLENPVPFFPVQPIPAQEHYTDEQVDRGNRDTDIGVRSSPGDPVSRNLVRISVILFAAIALVTAAMMLVFGVIRVG